MNHAQHTQDAAAPARPRKAGAFDVRVVIAWLIGFYGVVLAVMGLVAQSPRELVKTGGVNANLWAGITMMVVAAAFALWTRLRPVIIDPPPEPEDH